MGTELGESGRRGESWSATAEVAGLGVRAEDRWRDIRTLGANGVRTSLPDGRPVVQFASNDYLGLSGHPSVIAASVARERGYDVDKPRNLAKSVTVE